MWCMRDFDTYACQDTRSPWNVLREATTRRLSDACRWSNGGRVESLATFALGDHGAPHAQKKSPNRNHCYTTESSK